MMSDFYDNHNSVLKYGSDKVRFNYQQFEQDENSC